MFTNTKHNERQHTLSRCHSHQAAMLGWFCSLQAERTAIMDGNIYHNSSTKASIAWWIYLLLPTSEAMIGPLYKHQTAADLRCCCWLHLKSKREREKIKKKTQGKQTLIGRLKIEWKNKSLWLEENNHYFTKFKNKNQAHIRDQELQFYLLHSSVLSPTGFLFPTYNNPGGQEL